MKKRVLSLLLAVLMIASILPFSVFAEEAAIADEAEAAATVEAEDAVVPEEEAALEAEDAEAPEDTLVDSKLTAKLDEFTFTAEGKLPEGAKLRVAYASEETETRIQDDILDLGEMGDSRWGYAFDIKIVDAQGNEWQPEDMGVSVSISGFPVENASVDVYHFLDDAEAIDNAVADKTAEIVKHVDNSDGAFDAEIAAVKESESVSGKAVVYTEISDVENEGTAISFDTDSFSIYYIMTNSATRTIYFSTSGNTTDEVYVRPGETFTVYAQQKHGGLSGFQAIPCWRWEDNRTYDMPSSSQLIGTIPDVVNYDGNSRGFSYTLDSKHGYWSSDESEGSYGPNESSHKYRSRCVEIQVIGGVDNKYKLRCCEDIKNRDDKMAFNAEAELIIHVVNPIPITNKKVSVAIFNDGRSFANEPFRNNSNDDYVRLNGSLGIDTDHSTAYSTNADTLIKSEINNSDNFIQNPSNAAVWGVVSGTGDTTKPLLKWTEGNYDTIVQNYFNYRSTTSPLAGTADDYRFVPYVIKFQAAEVTHKNVFGQIVVDIKEGGKGAPPTDGNWYVDCIVVKKDQYIVYYDANVRPDYYVTNDPTNDPPKVPDGKVVNEGDSHVVGSTNLKLKKSTDTVEYGATFKYWEDQYGNRWDPNNTITDIDRDYLLHAVWDYEDQTQGALRIKKEVTKAEGSIDPDANQSFTIRVDFKGTAVNGSYVIYNAEVNGQLTGAGSTVNFNSKTLDVSLKAGQIVVVSGIPEEVEYEVSEPSIPQGYTLDNAESSDLTGTIVAGNTSRETVVNKYSYLPVTIYHVQNGAVVDSKTEVLKASDCAGGIDLTEHVSTAYLYAGTFNGTTMDGSHLADLHGGNPTNVVPVAGDKFYIKEIPLCYLQPQYFYTFNVHQGNKIADVYYVTGIDDENYNMIGFDGFEGKSILGATSGTTVYDSMTVKNFTYTVDKDMGKLGGFSEDSNKTFTFADIFGVNRNGKLFITRASESYGYDAIGDVTYKPYVITLDNVKVTGYYTRTIWNGVYKGSTTEGFRGKLNFVGWTAEYQAPVQAKGRPRMMLAAAPTYTANTYTSDEVMLFGITKYDNGEVISQVVPAGDNTGKIEYAGKDGSFFAGWFNDEACTEASDFSNVQSTVETYAKYIPEKDVKLSTIKSDLKLTTVNMKSTVSVGSNKFKEVGVVYNVNGSDTSVAAKQTTNKLNSVLNKLGAKLNTVEYDASFSIKGLKNNSTFTVTPYWVTMDGTTVYGNPVNYAYRLGVVVQK